MNQLIVVIFHLSLVLLHVEADTTNQSEHSSSENPTLQPSLAVVIGLLGVMSVITFLLLVYVKFCNTTTESAGTNPPQNNIGLISSSNRFSGIDKTVVESLPFFRFSSLKGSKEGLECVVCLSKFEDVEVLRLLPNCKHAFHVNCIDNWLEKHSSCPLCRQKVSSEDLKLITYSNSMRFLSNKQSELREDSNNMELFVEREESHGGSSRFSIGSSFRTIHEKGHHKEEELLIQQETEADQKVFHKHNHKITVSDFLFNSRWSNLSSSDLIFLNSEMLNDMSSSRFSSTDWNKDMSSTGKVEENEEIMEVKKEVEFRKSFQSKVGVTSTSASSSMLNSGEKRSVSEITSLSRYRDFGVKNRITESCSVFENNVKEERTRKIWLPIARRTVQRFANKEKSSKRQSLDV
ncbi:E3 ubiquitin-protein ligase ATL42 [Morus notabilis]|uniref:RING-type E3 ubiquitin transferase n=1 Tax=Morus notabilis TaxID=981085 RepID=W9SFZ7_9ROSA|nr:E3 ubiquitin-protein ligase ATL42 [Morus notabilis]EXC75523.1 E3 ubiquitin-protein ligase ATL42 [Morus notabilis]